MEKKRKINIYRYRCSLWGGKKRKITSNRRNIHPRHRDTSARLLLLLRFLDRTCARSEFDTVDRVRLRRRGRSKKAGSRRAESTRGAGIPRSSEFHTRRRAGVENKGEGPRERARGVALSASCAHRLRAYVYKQGRILCVPYKTNHRTGKREPVELRPTETVES